MMWKTVKIGDVCTIINGSTPLRGEKKYWEEGNVPWFTIDDFRVQGKNITYTQQNVTQAAVDDKKVRLVPKNSILLCCTASIGEVAIARKEMATNQQFNALTPNPAVINSDYLYFVATTLTQTLLNISGSTTINFISMGKLKEISIPLPPLTEQKRIVAKLDAAFAEIDNAIDAINTKETEIRNLQASLLGTFLSGNSEKWNKLALQDICSFISRGISPKYIEAGGVRVLNQKCIRNHFIDYSLSRRHDITKKVVKQERFIKKGDVLINSTGHGTLGRVAQVRDNPEEPTTVDSHITIVRPKDKFFYLDYFGYAAIFIEDEIKAAGQGTSGQTELSRTKLKEEFYISFPTDLKEQQIIVTKLDSAYNEFKKANEAIKKSKLNYLALKSAILAQELQRKVA